MSESRKKDTKQTTNQCTCTQTSGLFIPNRQLSVFFASGMMALFVSFMTGYFFGGKQANEQFASYAQQESLDKEIYASLCNFCDDEQLNEEDSADAPDFNDEQDTAAHMTQQLTLENMAQYYAQLIGFGTYRSAQRFVAKLQKRDISLIIKKRRSKSARGKIITWYQVVTEHYDDEHELNALVARLKKEENLKDTRIITC